MSQLFNMNKNKKEYSSHYKFHIKHSLMYLKKIFSLMYRSI